MNHSKVILVQPPIEDFYLTKKRTLPYGLASIAASVREMGFDVQIIDALATGKSKPMDLPESFGHLKPFYGQKDISAFSLFHGFRHFGHSHEHIGTLVRKEQPFIVGISSLFTAYCDQAIKTAETVKKFYPRCKIVMGGHHPTIFPEKVLKCDAVDFIIRGEGENSMAMLCKALQNQTDQNKTDPNKTDLEQIPGICFKKKDGLFLSYPTWIKDLNSLYPPAMDLVNQQFYQRKNKNSTIVVSSRGCPMHCSYCSVSASSSHAPFRQRLAGNVIRELELHNKNNIGFIDFEDENLCLNKQWFLSLFSEIKHLLGNNCVELRAMNGLYPPSIDEQIISVMKETGFKTLNLSLGSTSKEQLKKFQRRDVRASFEQALALAEKYNLECVSYIIAGAPGQSPQSSMEDLLYLAQKRTLIGLSIYYPAPGSRDFKLCKEKNILPKEFCLMRSTALPLDDTTSRIQAVTLLRLSRIINFMKHLMDTTGTIPKPEPSGDLTTFPLSERQKISEKLLGYFLYDGKIRGVTPNGEIYIHNTDENLTKQFIEKIKKISIAGVDQPAKEVVTYFS